jgi:hypothetical protein
VINNTFATQIDYAINSILHTYCIAVNPFFYNKKEHLTIEIFFDFFTFQKDKEMIVLYLLLSLILLNVIKTHGDASIPLPFDYTYASELDQRNFLVSQGIVKEKPLEFAITLFLKESHEMLLSSSVVSLLRVYTIFIRRFQTSAQKEERTVNPLQLGQAFRLYITKLCII